jgi:hypothetical protein
MTQRKKAAKKANDRTQVVKITLSRLVRQCASVKVRVPTGLDEHQLNEIARALYEQAEDDCIVDWEPDYSWGCDEGTHDVGTAARGSKPHYTAFYHLKDDGEVTVVAGDLRKR